MSPVNIGSSVLQMWPISVLWRPRRWTVFEFPFELQFSPDNLREEG